QDQVALRQVLGRDRAEEDHQQHEYDESPPPQDQERGLGQARIPRRSGVGRSRGLPGSIDMRVGHEEASRTLSDADAVTSASSVTVSAVIRPRAITRIRSAIAITSASSLEMNSTP